MQIAMVGLGRMGANMARRLMRDGPDCVVYDRDSRTVEVLVSEGVTGCASLQELAGHLEPPCAAWVMAVDRGNRRVARLLEPFHPAVLYAA